MESAGLRHRERHSHEAASSTPSKPLWAPKSDTPPDPDPDTAIPRPHASPSDGIQPPRFTVNLSLPPSKRYTHIVPQLADRIAASPLKEIFTDLIEAMFPAPIARVIRAISRLILRRVYSAEETAELRGISAAAGVPMYLLVAFNVVLDLLLGCTSGGALVDDDGRARIMHFRTLDWGMDPLRKLVVELDFVRREGGPVIATSVTYFGYVGVLTGVRKGLSMSLNFRPHHDRSSWRRRLGFRVHQVGVLLGLKRSVSSVLRQCLLTPDSALEGLPTKEKIIDEKARTRKSTGVSAPILDYIRDNLPSTASTAAYLIFCTPRKVYSLEKDHHSGAMAESDTFLTTYNHDRGDESNPAYIQAAAEELAETATGMEIIVSYSMNRKERMDKKWRRAVTKHCKGMKRPSGANAVSVEQVIKLVMDPHISNEETHYSVIMDPEYGRVIWRRVFDPPEDDSSSEGEPGEESEVEP